MDLDEAIRGRRSIRRYAAQQIADSVVRELLDLARHAPSSMNGQPWTFVVIRAPETKQKLAEIKNLYCPAEKREYSADFITGASVIIVVCVDKPASHDRDIENGVLAAAHILLAAHARGLGGVYMSAYRQDEPAVSAAVRHALGMPDLVAPVAILPLGYPDEIPGPKRMPPLDGAVSYERYGNKHTHVR